MTNKEDPENKRGVRKDSEICVTDTSFPRNEVSLSFKKENIVPFLQRSQRRYLY
jgi:hypothetical protein